MIALDFALGPAFEVVIASEPAGTTWRTCWRPPPRPFLPNKVVIFCRREDSPDIAQVVEYVDGFRPIEGKATAYVCRDFRCQLPTTSVETMLSTLANPSGDGR